jgi:ABC-type sulfate/molybdate transport systems ATPase subunit
MFVTHDQREAAEMGDRVALLLSGRLAQSGPPRDFYTEPATADVARFFGWCVLSGAQNGAGFRAGGGVFDVPADAARHAASGPLTAVAFHPSVVHVSDDRVEPGANGLPAIVEHVTDLGVRLRVGVRLASGQRLDIEQPVDRSLPAVAGGRASLSIPKSALRFFSSAT